MLARYLAAGGVIVFSADTTFDWFFARLLRPLIVELGPRSWLLANALLILSGGSEIFAFHDGAYRLISSKAHRDRSGAFDVLSQERRVQEMPALDHASTAYVGDSMAPRKIDHAMAERVGTVIDIGDAIDTASDEPIIILHRRYRRTIGVTRCRRDGDARGRTAGASAASRRRYGAVDL